MAFAQVEPKFFEQGFYLFQWVEIHAAQQENQVVDAVIFTEEGAFSEGKHRIAEKKRGVAFGRIANIYAELPRVSDGFIPGADFGEAVVLIIFGTLHKGERIAPVAGIGAVHLLQRFFAGLGVRRRQRTADKEQVQQAMAHGIGFTIQKRSKVNQNPPLWQSLQLRDIIRTLYSKNKL